MLDTKLKQQIVSKITQNFKVQDIILFGSYAHGVPNPSSDLDLVIVLNEKGFAQSYMEKIDRRIQVSKPLSDIEKEIPIDLLVYTKDEWNELVQANSSFIRQIIKKGIDLL